MNDGNVNMANFIQELRKSKNLTQKQLAEKLNITDKAVSKWERGLGYPDISILSLLAEVLGVTVNELLNGKRSVSTPSETNKVVEKTLQYANKVTSNKSNSINFIAKVIITLIGLLGILVCTICNIAISGTFTWSLYPIVSILFAWLIVMPIFQFRKNKILMSLISLSVFILPFIFILDKIIGGTKVMSNLVLPIILVVIAYIWIVYFLFSIKKASMWTMAAISVFLAIPLHLIINYIVAQFINKPFGPMWDDILSYGILCFISIILYLMKNKSLTFNNQISK